MPGSLTHERAARLAAHLAVLYGEAAGATCFEQLARLLDAASIPPRPGGLDERDVMLIAYGDHLSAHGQAPLAALHHFLRTYLHGTLSAVHLLPFFPATSDDGFAVSDYRAVDPALGSWEDVARFRSSFRLMFDLVLNHTSAAHPWFQSFLRGEPGYQDFFVTAPPARDLSAVVRPRTHPLLTPFATAAGTRHVWTTFSADQVDLNYANPAVLLAMLETLLFYVQQGADFIRLDAIAYLWKEPGTRCLHLPNTHRVVQVMRLVLDSAAPWVRLITETNVPHAENLSYFGDGYHEAQLVYQFALPPLVLHAFRSGRARALAEWAATLHTPSPATTFLNFTASHDGIGVQPARGLLSEAELAELANAIGARGGRISYKTNPDGSQSPYELNSTYFDALAKPGEPAPRAISRFIGSQALMLALAGLPAIYLPSLFGAPNWQAGFEQTGRARTLNREKYSLGALTQILADPGSRAAQVFQPYREWLTLRRAEPAFHPEGGQRVLDLHPAVFGLERTAPEGGRRLLALHNLGEEPAALELPPGLWHNVRHATVWNGRVTLRPYQVAWLRES